jgi:hypothetical protein
MMLVQMPESLADELCDSNGWKVALATRSGAVEVALEVVAAGSNLVSLVGAPDSIQGSLDTIRSWFRRNSKVTTIEVHGPSFAGRLRIRDEADIETAMAIVQTVIARTSVA